MVELPDIRSDGERALILILGLFRNKVERGLFKNWSLYIYLLQCTVTH